MERDFMGLAVKRETPDEVIDAAPLRSAAMPWSFPNNVKASSVPQLLSFCGAHEEKPRIGFDSLASAGLVTITTSASFDSDHKSYSRAMQNNIDHEKQGGPHYTMTTYPTKHLDGHVVRRPQTNLTVLPASVHHPFVAAVPTANPIPPMPSGGPVVGTTDLRDALKISGAPTQLTIFYNGAVCVYDNISPEKAHAIMLLAGNGLPLASSAPILSPPVQTSVPNSPVFDGFVVSQPYVTTMNRSSPTAIASISVSPSSGWSNGIKSMSASNRGPVIVSSNRVEPLQVASSPGPVSATYRPSETVPQFRRKSLARFLEKRKERVINASPYTNKRLSPGGDATPGAGSTTLSPKSSGSCPVSTVN